MQPIRRYGDHLTPHDTYRTDTRGTARRIAGAPLSTAPTPSEGPSRGTTVNSHPDLITVGTTSTGGADTFYERSRTSFGPPAAPAPFVIPTRRKVRPAILSVQLGEPSGPPARNVPPPPPVSARRDPPPASSRHVSVSPRPPPVVSTPLTRGELTETLPPGPEPKALDDCVRALKRFVDLLRQPGPYQYARAQQVAATLRNLGFVGLDAEMRDIVLMHFGPDSKKLDRVGLRQQHAFLADRQIRALTEMLAQRRANDKAGVSNAAGLTMDVYQALSPRMPLD